MLRHYPLPGGGPRPVRSPEEPFGRSDLTTHEKKAVWEDDVMMWRMLAIYGRSAECEGRPTGWLRVGAAGGSQEVHAWMPDL